MTIAQGTRFDCEVLGQVADTVAKRDPVVGEEFTQLVEGQCP